jgi:hypothetical protein
MILTKMDCKQMVFRSGIKNLNLLVRTLSLDIIADFVNYTTLCICSALWWLFRITFFMDQIEDERPRLVL